MHLLAVKQALAESCGETERVEICQAAALAFLRNDLGRWSGSLASHLDEESCPEVYRTAGRLLADFVDMDLAAAS